MGRRLIINWYAAANSWNTQRERSKKIKRVTFLIKSHVCAPIINLESNVFRVELSIFGKSEFTPAKRKLSKSSYSSGELDELNERITVPT